MNDTPEPCLCSAPNRFCHRAGVPMLGRLHELCQTSEAYRAAWDGQQLHRPPCKHQGLMTGTIPCETCAGRVQLKILRCDVHTECTIGKAVPGYACCVTCSDYEV